MSNRIQFRRGSTADRLAVIPENGEPVWDTEIKRVYVGDGVTPGGQHPFIPTAAEIPDLPASKIPDLASTAAGKGAALVGFIQSGASAVPRTMLEKGRERVSVADYGAIGDGATDDSAAILAALAAVGAGGQVVIPHGMRCYINSTVAVPDAGSLVGDAGPWRGYADNSSNFYQIGPALHLGPAGKVALNTGSSIADLVVIRAGLTFPVTYAAASAWTGYGIEALGDNFSVIGCSVFGFGTGIYSSGRQRMRIENVQGDCWNGIHIDNNFDTGVVSDCHFWPFLSAYGTLDKQQYRRNNGYKLAGVCDWTKLDNNFCYGYLKGYTIDGPDYVTLTACSADNIPPDASYHVGSVGFTITNGSNGVQLIGCQAAAQETGVLVSTGSGNTVTIIGGVFFASRVNGIVHTSGELLLTGQCIVRGQGALGSGIRFTSGSARAVIDDVFVVDYATPAIPINFDVATSALNVQLGRVTQLNTAPLVGGAGSYMVGDVASAGSVVIPANGDVFRITGSVNIGNFVTNVWAGRRITLVFAAPLTLVNSVSLSLAGNVNATVTAGTTISFVYNSGVWFETSRAIR